MGKIKIKERQKAIQLYITGNYTNKEIAEMVNVRPNTISEWISDIKRQLDVKMDFKELKELIKNNESLEEILIKIITIEKKVELLYKK